MTKRNDGKVTPRSTKGIGITPTRPDKKAVLGPKVMRELAREGSRKNKPRAA